MKTLKGFRVSFKNNMFSEHLTNLFYYVNYLYKIYIHIAKCVFISMQLCMHAHIT